jgi:hypothetical protein
MAIGGSLRVVIRGSPTDAERGPVLSPLLFKGYSATATRQANSTT